MGVAIQVVDDPQGLATANSEHGEQPGKIHISGGGAADWKGCLLVSARLEPEGDRWLAVEIQMAWKNSGQTLNGTFQINGVIWTWSGSCLESPQIDAASSGVLVPSLHLPPHLELTVDFQEHVQVNAEVFWLVSQLSSFDGLGKHQGTEGQRINLGWLYYLAMPRTGRSSILPPTMWGWGHNIDWLIVGKINNLLPLLAWHLNSPGDLL
ncbi:hypothetical protein BKA83DRAFT_4130596 [Pisolithus microcarpus]|nr:hypothetical protein BKA83DRAFT_4130596 [Pisolithus microcarpus]